MEIKGYVLIPKATIKKNTPIGYMYREEPDNMYDSGWRMFAGDESDEYVNNPENIGMYDISTIINMYPYVRPYLTFPCGSVLERNKNSFVFRNLS